MDRNYIMQKFCRIYKFFGFLCMQNYSSYITIILDFAYLKNYQRNLPNEWSK